MHNTSLEAKEKKYEKKDDSTIRVLLNVGSLISCINISIPYVIAEYCNTCCRQVLHYNTLIIPGELSNMHHPIGIICIRSSVTQPIQLWSNHVLKN